MNITDLKAVVNRYGNGSEKREMESSIDKSQLVALAKAIVSRSSSSLTKYDLISSIVSNEATSGSIGEAKAFASSTPTSTIFTHKINVVNKKTNLWFAIEDLEVREILPSAVCLEEAVLLIYEKRK